MSKEKSDEYWEGYIQKQNESMEICKICRYRTKFRELEKQEDSILENKKWVSDKLISKERIKRVKETLHEFDSNYSYEAIDENGNIIDKEADRLATIFNEAWYYIEQLENKLADSTPNSVIREKIEDLNFSGGNDGKDEIENQIRQFTIEILEEILKEGEKR